MNLLINIRATGDGKMKNNYALSNSTEYTREYDLRKAWLSIVYRFMNFAKKDIDRIETFFINLQSINENNGY